MKVDEIFSLPQKNLNAGLLYVQVFFNCSDFLRLDTETEIHTWDPFSCFTMPMGNIYKGWILAISYLAFVCYFTTLSEETAHSNVYHHLKHQSSCIKTAQSLLTWRYTVKLAVSAIVKVPSCLFVYLLIILILRQIYPSHVIF